MSTYSKYAKSSQSFHRNSRNVNTSFSTKINKPSNYLKTSYRRFYKENSTDMMWTKLNRAIYLLEKSHEHIEEQSYQHSSQLDMYEAFHTWKSLIFEDDLQSQYLDSDNFSEDYQNTTSPVTGMDYLMGQSNKSPAEFGNISQYNQYDEINNSINSNRTIRNKIVPNLNNNSSTSPFFISADDFDYSTKQLEGISNNEDTISDDGSEASYSPDIFYVNDDNSENLDTNSFSYPESINASDTNEFQDLMDIKDDFSYKSVIDDVNKYSQFLEMEKAKVRSEMKNNNTLSNSVPIINESASSQSNNINLQSNNNYQASFKNKLPFPASKEIISPMNSSHETNVVTSFEKDSSKLNSQITSRTIANNEKYNPPKLISTSIASIKQFSPKASPSPSNTPKSKSNSGLNGSDKDGVLNAAGNKNHFSFTDNSKKVSGSPSKLKPNTVHLPVQSNLRSNDDVNFPASNKNVTNMDYNTFVDDGLLDSIDLPFSP